MYALCHEQNVLDGFAHTTEIMKEREQHRVKLTRNDGRYTSPFL
jgi:hypothetical protein